mmetsp:Transcript_60680/g.141383  ORF Transcript_60680/g.141383 Transcript_60680/m.141383 type:complete len:203 (+) Transcript_60680:319-927(+)
MPTMRTTTSGSTRAPALHSTGPSGSGLVRLRPTTRSGTSVKMETTSGATSTMQARPESGRVVLKRRPRRRHSGCGWSLPKSTWSRERSSACQEANAGVRTLTCACGEWLRSDQRTLLFWKTMCSLCFPAPMLHLAAPMAGCSRRGFIVRLNLYQPTLTSCTLAGLVGETVTTGGGRSFLRRSEASVTVSSARPNTSGPLLPT